MMASRVAAQLQKENDIPVETMKGGLGEFSVYIDGQKVIDTNRFLYPNPGKIVRKILALIAQ